ncbi:MAG: ATP-binding cassette domain-containing protein, partial [Candidatus Hydrogenedentes bacterium]|nr:ATP-binding cassette domain-containing protein [Candidatus Hydrogenedentota bacterium]
MKRITKRFGEILANDSVEFSAFSGEIHGLIGENGAGKSTLMKILGGMYRADDGEIHIDGKRVAIGSPHIARQRGIAMVYQQFSLVEALTALENVVLCLEPGSFFLRNLGDVERLVREICRKFNFTFELSSRVSDLAVGEKQQLEIVKALVRGAELLILDEPTSLLAPPEVEPLFGIIRTLRAEGKTVVFISHKLEEVMDVADRITVMREGRVVATGERNVFCRDTLAELIVGARPERKERRRARRKRPPRVARDKLRVERLCLTRDGREVLRKVSFSLRQGEILGVAGVVGNGQSELAEVLAGFVTPTSGKIVIDGVAFPRLSPAQARRAGIAHIPE